MVGKFGRCPRCGGNMLLEADLDGWYVECLQCSYWRELEDVFSGAQGAQTNADTSARQMSISESLASSLEPDTVVGGLKSAWIREQKGEKGQSCDRIT